METHTSQLTVRETTQPTTLGLQSVLLLAAMTAASPTYAAPADSLSAQFLAHLA